MPRDGADFTILSIEGILECGIADFHNQIRYTIVLNQNDTGTPTIATVYTGVVGAYADTFNYARRKEHKILSDSRISLGTNSTTVLKKIHIEGPIAVNLSDTVNMRGFNMPYMLISSDSGAVSHPATRLCIRVLYRDG
jgi:hypothetical protein